MSVRALIRSLGGEELGNIVKTWHLARTYPNTNSMWVTKTKKDTVLLHMLTIQITTFNDTIFYWSDSISNISLLFTKRYQLPPSANSEFQACHKTVLPKNFSYYESLILQIPVDLWHPSVPKKKVWDSEKLSQVSKSCCWWWLWNINTDTGSWRVTKPPAN